MPNVTTSLPLESWNLAKEKHLKWTDCLIAGINLLANKYIPMAEGETILDESAIAKKEQSRMMMQEHIYKLNDELDQLREKKDGRKRFP